MLILSSATTWMVISLTWFLNIDSCYSLKRSYGAMIDDSSTWNQAAISIPFKSEDSAVKVADLATGSFSSSIFTHGWMTSMILTRFLIPTFWHHTKFGTNQTCDQPKAALKYLARPQHIHSILALVLWFSYRHINNTNSYIFSMIAGTLADNYGLSWACKAAKIKTDLGRVISNSYWWILIFVPFFKWREAGLVRFAWNTIFFFNGIVTRS